MQKFTGPMDWMNKTKVCNSVINSPPSLGRNSSETVPVACLLLGAGGATPTPGPMVIPAAVVRGSSAGFTFPMLPPIANAAAA